MEVLKVVLASLFSAAILFVIAKIIGHKQVAQLGTSLIIHLESHFVKTINLAF